MYVCYGLILSYHNIEAQTEIYLGLVPVFHAYGCLPFPLSINAFSIFKETFQSNMADLNLIFLDFPQDAIYHIS